MVVMISSYGEKQKAGSHDASMPFHFMFSS